MAEVVVEIPVEFKLDKALRLKLKRDVESVVRLRLARELILKRLDKLLKNSKLTDEDCLRLGREVNKAVHGKWEERGWL